MWTALLLVAPGLLASSIYCGAKGIPLKSVDFLVHAASFMLVITVFVVGSSYLRGHGAAPPEQMFLNIAQITKYGALAILAAVALPPAVLLVEGFFMGRKHG